jgi:hypothetical protein
MLRLTTLALPFAVVLVSVACSPSTPPPAPDAAAPKKVTRPDAAVAKAMPDAAPAKSWTVDATLDLAEAPDGTFTSGGRVPPPGPEFALFRVVESPPVTAKDRAGDAKKRLASTDLATGVKPEGQRPIKVDGLDGFETAGRGKLDKTDVSFYQVVLYDAAGTYTMQGRSSTERFAWYQPAYQKMARSFRRKAP